MAALLAVDDLWAAIDKVDGGGNSGGNSGDVLSGARISSIPIDDSAADDKAADADANERLLWQLRRKSPSIQTKNLTLTAPHKMSNTST